MRKPSPTFIKKLRIFKEKYCKVTKYNHHTSEPVYTEYIEAIAIPNQIHDKLYKLSDKIHSKSLFNYKYKDLLFVSIFDLLDKIGVGNHPFIQKLALKGLLFNHEGIDEVGLNLHYLMNDSRYTLWNLSIGNDDMYINIWFYPESIKSQIEVKQTGLKTQ